MPTPDHTITSTQLIEGVLSQRLPDELDMRSTQIVKHALVQRIPDADTGDLDMRCTQLVVMVLAKRAGPVEDLQYGLPLVGVMR